MKPCLKLPECEFYLAVSFTACERVFIVHYSIHLVHDDSKDKEFELELSWIGAETNGLHLPVPKDLFEEADKKGRDALDADMED